MRAFDGFQRLLSPSTLFVLGAALIGGICIGLVPYGYEVTRPSVVLDILSDLDSVTVRGGAIDLMVRVDHQRSCSTSAKRWLWRYVTLNGKQTQQWVFLNTPSSPPVPIGHDVGYILRLPLPPAIEAGTWFYKAEVTDHCSWFPDFMSPRPRESQDVQIDVTEPTITMPAAVSAPPGATLLLPEGAK